MAPSRGASLLRKSCHAFPALQRTNPRLARSLSSFASLVSNPTSTRQIYISLSHSPFVNLSIEHFLLQKTPPDSAVLFLYTNGPSIILGRNQNPWVEVNLGLLGRRGGELAGGRAVPRALRENPPLLVRRRSGGGTVFHDLGNVNYCVIAPTADFHRDKHAEMVVRALHRLGVTHARVNERHDIVLASDAQSTPRKISGSAYKLTHRRSLHHGTCLLSSPYLATIPLYLRSPAKAYIRARGVESVSSPVANAGVSNKEFEEAVVAEFRDMYGIGSGAWEMSASDGICEGKGWIGGFVGEEDAEVEDIALGIAELKVSTKSIRHTIEHPLTLSF
ncbi:MAG: Biotin/lipoate A/B protein ligase [Trichoglossum hirsutum]|jgi:lipoate-protein ligase A|nr:MAG: Biotin/lipoate A/B protein ligase [Trichoglossum hirsutum]